MALEQYGVVPDGICWSVDDYSGTQDFDDIYLGDRAIEVTPEVTMKALFSDGATVAEFMVWWRDNTDNGVKAFSIPDIRIFGKLSTYVVEQISDLSHKDKDDSLTFKARVLYDSDSVGNTPPIASDVLYSIEKNTINNYILLTAVDAEDDSLTFEVISQPTFGTLTGTPPALSYTPDTDFADTDSFTYLAKDVFNNSNLATVTLAVGVGEVAIPQFDYNASDDIYVSGNYHYDNGNGNIQRGSSDNILLARIHTPNTFIGRASIATYTDGGILKYAAIDEERIQDLLPFYEEAATNLLLQSNDFLTTWVTGINIVDNGLVISPDGTVNARSLSSINSGGAYQLQAVTPSVDTEYVFSVYARSPNPSLLIDGQVLSIHREDTSSELLSATLVTTDWQRFELQFNSENSDFLQLYLGYDWTSGGTIEFFGAQIEEGIVATSYIPTTTAAVTRAKDNVQYPITIWSNDHKIESNEHIVTAKVIKWGERLSYEDFMMGYPNITSFTIDDGAGICQGTVFTRMFKGFPSFIRKFNTSNGIYFASMFEGCQSAGIPYFDFSRGIYFQSIFKNSLIKNTQAIESYNGQYFQEAFMGSDIECIGGIDTSSAINTLKMFNTTANLVNPNVTEQADIIEGLNQPFVSAQPCIMTVDGITEIIPAIATIPLVDGTGTATGTYEVEYHDETLPISYQWTVTGATILGSSIDKTVVIEDIIAVDTQFTISCAVTDAVGTVDSGNFLFNEYANYTYLQLTLAKQYDLLNLETYIDANGGEAETEILIINTLTNGPIETGDLTGKNVKLVNTGHIQGYSTTSYNTALGNRNNGLSVTTAIMLDNSSGTISGCGGYAGTGGKGLDTSNGTVQTTLYFSASTTWSAPAHLTHVDLCMIGGGGGAGDNVFCSYIKGGHGGNIYTGSSNITGGTTQTITIGNGGAKNAYGGTTYFNLTTATGGQGGQYLEQVPVRYTCLGTFYDGTGHGSFCEDTQQWWLRSGGGAGFQNGPAWDNSATPAKGAGASGAGYWGGKGYMRLKYDTLLVGGAGGGGGRGAGYDYSATGVVGSTGSLSNPTGGNTGGTGGTGGEWGTTGNTGDTGGGGGDVGLTGNLGGNAITGNATLKAGSFTGTTNGDIT